MLLDAVERLEGGRIRDPENGLIMPWYTSPCLEWLRTLNLKEKDVFEYGCGESTNWYISKGAHVCGVDSSKKWIDKCNTFIRFETELVWYVSAVGHLITRVPKEKFVEWDIIVIDGLFRDECTQPALERLKSGGYLIIDNYKQKSADLEHWPLTEKLIEGLPITIYKEPNHEDWQTAVITKI